MTEYSKFDKVMDELLTSKDGTTIVNFNGGSLKEFADHQDVFWDGLLQYLQNENQKEPFEGTYGVRQSMFPSDIDVQGVIEYINDNADLIDSFLDRCLKSKSEQGFLPHWNKGFEKTLQIYRDYFVDNGSIIYGSMSVKDITEADAGNSFKRNEEWVCPWHNYTGDTYDTTRANDKIVRVLTDKNRLQFTQMFNKYIRLLMPEYQRIVEVEDLNRNFWVIGQVLTGILEFLFSEDSPINRLIDGILDEIAQLWENLLYLWVGFALISQELDKNDIQIIVIPVNNNQFQPYVKFDNFDKLSYAGAGHTLDDLRKISVWGPYWTNHLEYLKRIYKESTLVVIPEVRRNSYQENFYTKVYYPGAFVYNRRLPQGIANLSDKNATDGSIIKINDERLSWFAFRFPSTPPPVLIADYKPFVIDIMEESKKFITEAYTFEHNPWGVYEKSPYYNFIGDYKDANSIPNVPYVAAIRTTFSEPAITIQDGVITALTMKVTCTDVVKDIYNTESDVVDSKMMEATFALEPVSHGAVRILEATANFYDSSATPSNPKKKITKGWYRGEVASWFNINEPQFTVTINKSWIDIKDSTPATTASIKVSGKDQLGFEYEGTTITFDLTGHVDDDQTKTITVPAYSGSGNLLSYTFKEQPLKNKQWVCTSENTSLTFNSTNKVVNFFNKWSAIDFNGQVNIITKIYTSWGNAGVEPEEYGGQYATLQDFIDALETTVEKEKWQDWIDTLAADMTENSARFYASHYVYRNGTQTNFNSYLEISPYVTLVIKDEEGIHKYNFIYNIVDNSTMHTSIKYPFMSSVYNNISVEAAKSTEKLCQWNSAATPTTDPEIYINRPTNAIHSQGFVTKGNLAYGDAVFRENDNPNGARQGIRISFINEVPYLSNFLILGMDRACAGTNGMSDFFEGALIPSPTKVKDLYPYYYKCEISRGARETTVDDDGFGEITATVVFNDTKTGLKALEPAPGHTEKRYQWADPANRPYSETIIRESGEDPGFSSWAQMGMGRVESEFLSVIHPLLEVETEDE